MLFFFFDPFLAAAYHIPDVSLILSHVFHASSFECESWEMFALRRMRGDGDSVEYVCPCPSLGRNVFSKAVFFQGRFFQNVFPLQAAGRNAGTSRAPKPWSGGPGWKRETHKGGHPTQSFTRRGKECRHKIDVLFFNVEFNMMLKRVDELELEEVML